MSGAPAPKKGAEIQALDAQPVPGTASFSVSDVDLTEIEYRGVAKYAKLSLGEGEDAKAVLQRFKQGEEARGQCTLVCKPQTRGSREWRLTCCYGKHDKRERQLACESGPDLLHGVNSQQLTPVPDGAPAAGQRGLAQGAEAAGAGGAKPQRRKKTQMGDSIKLGCAYTVNVKETEDNCVLIRVGNGEHVDAQGVAVHADRGAAHLSEELKDWVYEKLAANVPTKSILAGARGAPCCDPQ